MTTRFPVRKVAVLGAGVMGAQIAAHLVNCKVPVLLFDLPANTGPQASPPPGGAEKSPSAAGSTSGPKNGIVTKAIDNLKKLKPAPLGIADDAVADPGRPTTKNTWTCWPAVTLIIEAIAERMDWKLDLYKRIAPAVAPHAIVASNTSGLSITKLARGAARQHQAALSAASTSSTRRATWRWWS